MADTTQLISTQVDPIALPDAAAIEYASGDVRHLSIEDALNSVNISNATRNLAYRDNQLAAKLNELIGVVNNQENLVNLPSISTYLAPGQVLDVANYRIPSGYEARVMDLAVSSNPLGVVLAEILYSASTYGASSGLSAASTYSEVTGGTSFYGTGEFILRLTNSGTTGATSVASVMVSTRPVTAQQGGIIGPGVEGEQGPVGPPGPPGPPGIGIPGAPGLAGLTWRGVYNPASAYAQNDAVSYNFGNGVGIASFICLVPCTGVAPPLPTLAPSTNWGILNYATPSTPDSVIAPLSFTGTLTLGSVFGYFVAPYAGYAESAQVFLQSAPGGGSVSIDLLSSTSTLYGQPVAVATATNFAGTTFASPISLTAGQYVQAKVSSLKGTFGGANATYNLFFQALV